MAANKRPIDHNTTKLWFGKHKGKTLFTIASEDPTYIFWLEQQDIIQVNDLILDIAKRHSLKKDRKETNTVDILVSITKKESGIKSELFELNRIYVQIKFKRSRELKFDIYHNTPEYFPISKIIPMWANMFPRDTLSAKHLCEYMDRNTKYLCYTEQQFNQL